MLASVTGLTFPGTVKAPPIKVTLPTSLAIWGSFSKAAAKFVKGPVGTITRSLPYLCAASMKKSIPDIVSGLRSAFFSLTSPIPFLPWIWALIGITSKLSLVEACGSPVKTGMSGRPNSSSKSKLFWTPSSTKMLPYEPTIPIRSHSSEAKA